MRSPRRNPIKLIVKREGFVVPLQKDALKQAVVEVQLDVGTLRF